MQNIDDHEKRPLIEMCTPTHFARWIAVGSGLGIITDESPNKQTNKQTLNVGFETVWFGLVISSPSMAGANYRLRLW